MAPSVRVDTPRFFVSPGTSDRVLPIVRCSRRIVPQLERAGYEVIYREFDGGHTVRPEVAPEAAGRFALSQGGSGSDTSIHLSMSVPPSQITPGPERCRGR